ncbi:MAG TPA: hypothetical protein EYQ09_05595 [Flavobacteriales bacterium]|nr:hypothetical protein [Flavobacteriales bacterium]
MKKYLFTLLAGLIGFSSYSQDIKDGKSLIEAYVSPLGYSLGAALNNGWYNTAKPHKLGGFDVTITANIVMIPEEAKSFNISKSNGNTFSGGETPTVLGNGDGAKIDYQGNLNEMPKGINIPIVPLPMLQAGVGLIKGTEIDIRYMPELKISSIGKVGLFGIGLKHDVLQWLPIVDKIPIDLSIQAGYTNLTTEIMLSEPNLNTEATTNLDISATTINLILSKKVLMFTPYIGLGYNSIKTAFNIDEDYNIAGLNIDIAELTKIEFESKNNFRANIGFRFNVTVIALQANYTFSEYPTATLGVGISLR